MLMVGVGPALTVITTALELAMALPQLPPVTDMLQLKLLPLAMELVVYVLDAPL
jgi:hypothetical protein